MFRRVSGARSYQIRVSPDKRSWATVATFDYADPLIWQRAQFTATARYVQFVFFNPTSTSSLGYLAEIKVFGSDGSFDPAADLATESVTATVPPTATVTPPSIEASPIAVDPTDVVIELGTLTAESPAPTDITDGVDDHSSVVPVLSLVGDGSRSDQGGS
jgi:hypothetical protein